MSKKQFSTGLDSVFSEEAQFEPNIDNSPWLLETSEGVAVAKDPAVAKKARVSESKSTRRSGKSFTSDLESLFAAASVERPREVETPSEEISTRTRNRPRRRMPAFSGLDGLIRDTTNGKIPKAIEEDVPSVRKRVTFTYDRDRFSRLKSIARVEGNYLKDIISSLLNDYINQYEKDAAFKA
ncbi:MAG: hypothetical protein AB8F78_06805 [Saprospiraceae bacterium]